MDKIESSQPRKNVWITDIPQKLIQDSIASYGYSSKQIYKMT